MAALVEEAAEEARLARTGGTEDLAVGEERAISEAMADLAAAPGVEGWKLSLATGISVPSATLALVPDREV